MRTLVIEPLGFPLTGRFVALAEEVVGDLPLSAAHGEASTPRFSVDSPCTAVQVIES
ncbi:MAG: hypothetical protein LC808_35905 [Actinobacteria bacterium]|nr:hypothetical protein [Actinomycetota bacterium]